MSDYSGLKARLAVCAKYDPDQADAIAAITELEAERDALRQELDGVLKMIGEADG